MKPFESIIDIKMTPDGDLSIKDEDLETHNGIDWFISEVTKIIRTSNPDWKKYPNIGAGVEEFAGMPNTRETAMAIKERIHDKITAENLQYPGKLEVSVVPLDRHTISIYINLSVNGEFMQISKVIFDYNDGIIKSDIIEKPRMESELEDLSGKGRHVPARNPYLTRLQ
jgi:hypothetical protein